jgi:beta-galactosidase
MKMHLLLVWLFAISSFSAEIVVNKRPLSYYIDNTAVFEENQNRPHAPIAPFEQFQNAITNEWTRCPWVISLNGEWKFQWHERPEEASWNFYKPDFDVSSWKTIDVPSDWQLKGYGDLIFRNVMQPFPPDPPHPPSDYNPVGSYRRSFNIPNSWKDRHIFLYFEGVKTAAFIWVNGSYIGYNEGGMEPAEFDVTEAVRPGSNELAVQVLRYADATYLEDQDMWRLSGIYRSVYLLAMPSVYIQDYYITTDLDEAYRDAVLHIEFEISNQTKHTLNRYYITGSLFDASGQRVQQFEKPAGTINSGETVLLSTTCLVENPLKWSAEKPNLYALVLELRNPLNQVIHTLVQGAGFREVEIHDQALWINGVPVKLNGVCSHVHHPVTGRAMDQETMLRDLTLMKQFNINCVRTSHYPQNREYYDLADRLGLYIIDETNDEAHCTTWLSREPEWRDMYLDRARKMVFRDRNHPSIIIWSAGNESGNGSNICDLIAEGKRIDPSRPGWLYGGNNDYYPGTGPMDCEDIAGPRYPTPADLQNDIAQSEDPRPSFMDEYVAVTGNGGGMFDEFWKVIRSNRRTVGGAVWDWVSPTILTDWIVTRDESPFKNQAAIMGRFHLVPGHFGNALLLSGHDAWVEIYRAPELDLNGETLTLSFWIQPRAWNGPETFISKGDWQFGIRQPQPDSLAFYLTTDQRDTLKCGIPENWAGFWHHVLAVYDGQSMKLWIDNRLVRQRSKTGTIVYTPFPINIGRNGETDDQEFAGTMCDALLDRIAVFETAVTPDDLKSMGPEDSRLWLDFESVEKTGSFYSYGIGGRTYGLIWANRIPQPELSQLKKSAQPVTVEAVNLVEGLVKIFNQYHFTNLNELICWWAVTAEGTVLKDGILTLDLPPLESQEVMIPYGKIKSPAGVRSYLKISFSLPEATAWAPAYHEVAFEQFELPFLKICRKMKTKSKVPLQIHEGDSMLTVTGSDFRYAFSMSTGMLVSIQFRGEEILTEGLHVNMWRAPLANDLDRWTYGRARVTNAKPWLSGFAVNGFMAAGLDRLRQTADRFYVKENDEGILVRVKALAAADGCSAVFHNQYDYMIYPSGDMVLTHTLTPDGEMPSYLPCAGVQWVLNPDFQQWSYLGRGPFENYPDRKTAAALGLYKTTVDEAYVPYLIPQDYGNRCDTYWSVFSNGKTGIFIQADSVFNISAHPFNEQNLSRALLIPQLQPFGGITVNVGYRVSGVGCTAVSILDRYRVFPEEMVYKIRIKPYSVTETDPIVLGREGFP